MAFDKRDQKDKSQGEKDRERELSVRKARSELAKTQVSVIVHSPAQK